MNLERLDQDVKEILLATVNAVEAKKLRFPYEAINWGDLYCEGIVERVVVRIREASPASHTLRDHVRKELVQRGYDTKAIEIITEW